MKKILTIAARTSPLPTPIGFSVVAALAAAFWFSTPVAVAQQTNCTVCHKRTRELTFPCNSLEYRRHLDHGDRMGSCDMTPTQNP